MFLIVFFIIGSNKELLLLLVLSLRRPQYLIQLRRVKGGMSHGNTKVLRSENAFKAPSLHAEFNEILLAVVAISVPPFAVDDREPSYLQTK